MLLFMLYLTAVRGNNKHIIKVKNKKKKKRRKERPYKIHRNTSILGLTIKDDKLIILILKVPYKSIISLKIGVMWFVIFIEESQFMQSDSVNSVDLINDQFDEYQLVLSVKEKRLKLLVDFSDSDECNELISLLGDIKDKDIVL